MKLELTTFKELRVGQSFITDIKETPVYIFTILSIANPTHEKRRYYIKSQYDGETDIIRLNKTRVLKVI